MLQEKETFFRRFMIGIDVSCVILAYLMTYLVQGVLKEPGFSLWEYAAVLVPSAPLWGLTLYANGMYRSMRTHSYLEVVWILIKAAGLTFFASGAFLFLLKLTYFSRRFFLMFTGISFLFIFLGKTVLFLSAHYIRRQSMNTQRLLIVGTGARAVEFIKKIERHPEWGFKILGAIDDEPSRGLSRVDGLKIIGALEDIPEIFRREAVDEVVFVVPRSRLNYLVKAIEDCETEGIAVTIAVDLFDTRLAKSSVTELDGLPLLHLKTTHCREWQLFLKRMFDLGVSGLGILLLSPLMLVMAVLIKATSPGPILFKQPRLGLHGRRFTLFKFRTMKEGAQEALVTYRDLEEMTTPEFRMKKTFWITPVGRFLRKFSLDELPQLFNVFIGHMSLVGPRPTVPDEVEKYKAWHRRRFSMKPGITCLWQVSGRNKIGFEEWMKLDLEYLDRWSLRMDLIILLRTIPVVFFGYGAY